MSASCGSHHETFDGTSDAYRRRLRFVITINAAMFAIEMVAGHAANSQALQADALDFFANSLTYGLSLAVIGGSVGLRANVALAKGISLLAMGCYVAGATLWRIFFLGLPQAEVMGAIAFLALAANVASVMLLVAYKDGDANVRSVWLCSRNDAIGNVAVMLAALGVRGTATAWPDLIVAAIMSALFLSSAFQIITQAIRERRSMKPDSAAPSLGSPRA